MHVNKKKIELDHFITRVNLIFHNFVGQSRLLVHKHYIIINTCKYNDTQDRCGKREKERDGQRSSER